MRTSDFGVQIAHTTGTPTDWSHSKCACLTLDPWARPEISRALQCFLRLPHTEPRRETSSPCVLRGTFASQPGRGSSATRPFLRLPVVIVKIRVDSALGGFHASAPAPLRICVFLAENGRDPRRQRWSTGLKFLQVVTFRPLFLFLVQRTRT